MKVVFLISILLGIRVADALVNGTNEISTCYRIINTGLTFLWGFVNIGFGEFVPPYIMMTVVIDYERHEDGRIFWTETLTYHMKHYEDPLCKVFTIDYAEEGITRRVSSWKQQSSIFL
ncbi:hypothetical protein RF11_00459 [Thelohanellus kitauei]|uniref:Uncharacterized protein n=1 Tax=Thelohanellus kitauei TaxID=669202 RepID=A0A0C2INQ6_THEKT|nr:hypothetical protein RF11_00459 [Thelohanellus kitauei]